MSSNLMASSLPLTASHKVLGSGAAALTALTRSPSFALSNSSCLSLLADVRLRFLRSTLELLGPPTGIEIAVLFEKGLAGEVSATTIEDCILIDHDRYSELMVLNVGLEFLK